MKTTLLLVCLVGATLVPAVQAQDDPDPARFQSAIDAFQKQNRAQPPPDGAILFVGSSSIRMWPTDARFPDLPVVNRGFGGSQISDVLHFFDEVVVPAAPRAVVFYAGDNDVADGKSAERVLQDYRAFAERVHARFPEADLLYLPIKPSLSRWRMWPEMARANEAVRRLSEDDDRLHYVDLATPMLGANGRPRPDLFLEDGLHLNERGYDLWTEILRPRLDAVLAR